MRIQGKPTNKTDSYTTIKQTATPTKARRKQLKHQECYDLEACPKHA